jgi:hypothetical protein
MSTSKRRPAQVPPKARTRPAKPAHEVTPAEVLAIAAKNPLRAVLTLRFEVRCVDLPLARALAWPWHVCHLDIERRTFTVFNPDEHSMKDVQAATRAELERAIRPFVETTAAQ